jgi:hypothetical protein
VAASAYRLLGISPPRPSYQFDKIVGLGTVSVCDIAALLRKHPNSVAKWLNRGLRLKRTDPAFKARLDHLDAAISERS